MIVVFEIRLDYGVQYSVRELVDPLIVGCVVLILVAKYFKIWQI